MTTELSFWIFFILFIALMMAPDPGVFRRKSHIVTFKESLAWTIVWMGLAGILNVFRYLHFGLASILLFMGLKMVLADVYKIPIEFALITELAILIISIVASLIIKPAIKKLT